MACALALIAWPVEAKKPRPPIQPTITIGCVAVSPEQFHGTGWGFPEPELDITIHNGCTRAASVFLTIGYFDGKGIQLGSGVEAPTVAAGSSLPVRHIVYTLPHGDWLGFIKSMRIIEAECH